MHKSIKTFVENEGIYSQKFLFFQSTKIFSANFIRFAQQFDADIKDIRGLFLLLSTIILYSENRSSLKKTRNQFVLFSILFCMII